MQSAAEGVESGYLQLIMANSTAFSPDLAQLAVLQEQREYELRLNSHCSLRLKMMQGLINKHML